MNYKKQTNNKLASKLDRIYVRFGGVFAVLVYKIISWPVRKKVLINRLKNDIIADESVLFISNHAKRLDPPATFSAVSLRQLWNIAPIKFMTWRRYYYSVLLPLLYLTGSFPTHGKKNSGVPGAANYLQSNYRVSMFPEGSMTTQAKSKPYKGIVELLASAPDVRVILVNLTWQSRSWSVLRPKLTVIFADPPKNFNRKDPAKIMDAIYNLQK